MTANGWFQIGFYLVVIFLLTKPVGIFMTRVFNREKTFLDPFLRPIERVVYRLTGVDEKHEMRWTEYAIAMLLFSGVSMALLYLIERTQKWLPFNPQKFPNVEPGLAFGTAASFTTNTNWQAYSGESTMSYLTQMTGLAYHNFASAAVGIVLAIVVIRMLPVAPYFVVNLAAGAARVPFRDFVLGSVIGISPGVIGITLFEDQLEQMIRSPSLLTLVTLAVILSLMLLGVTWFRRWSAPAILRDERKINDEKRPDLDDSAR